jgi:putative endonuclease
VDAFVYILGSSGKGGFRTYVGWTDNLDRRLSQHNAERVCVIHADELGLY